MKYVFTNYREFKDGEESRPYATVCDSCKITANTMVIFKVEKVDEEELDVVICPSCMHKFIAAMNKLSIKMFRGEIENGEGTNIE